MFRTLALLALAAHAQAGPAVDTYISDVSKLISAHRDSVTRLTAPANASAAALIAGGRFYLSSIDNRAWFYEGIGRAGGVMQTLQFTADTTLLPNDVVWISYTAATYQNALDVSTRLAPQKVVVVAFGPKLPTGPPTFTYWVDSLTSWSADDNLVLCGNVLSLWTMEGELAAAVARQGKSLVFWQSILAPSSPTRNNHYSGILFHDGFPKMLPADPGAMSTAYLDTVCDSLGQITDSELPQITAAGQQLAERSAAGNPPTLVVTSHLLPFINLENSTLFRYVSDPAAVDEAIARSGFLIDFGYSGVDLELWRKVRLANASAVWITGELPNQTDFSGHSDILIDEHWQYGDASVLAPGYDVRLLPMSGIAQLFIYELLVKAATEPRNPMVPALRNDQRRGEFTCLLRSTRGGKIL